MEQRNARLTQWAKAAGLNPADIDETTGCGDGMNCLDPDAISKLAAAGGRVVLNSVTADVTSDHQEDCVTLVCVDDRDVLTAAGNLYADGKCLRMDSMTCRTYSTCDQATRAAAVAAVQSLARFAVDAISVAKRCVADGQERKETPEWYWFGRLQSALEAAKTRINDAVNPDSVDSGPRHKYICEVCHGENLTFDANLYWNSEAQDWEHGGPFDDGFCNDCEEECKGIAVAVDWKEGDPVKDIFVVAAEKAAAE